MTTLKERIEADIKSAMKAKEALRLDVLRMVRADILLQQTSGDTARTLTDDEVMKRIETLIKQRKEAAAAFTTGGRPELADKELGEIKVLEEYLPQGLDDATMTQIVEKALADAGAFGPKDMGKAMGKVMAALKATGQRFDGAKANAIAKAKLGA